ncbi:MAG: NTP transferase domain-containing protein [Candidatus Hydrogenedentota bacterium]
MKPILSGGIIAAGEGSRLKAGGKAGPKPLVTIGGIALVERVLMNMQAAGITQVTTIFNEDDRECDAWVRARFSELTFRNIIRTTPSSWASFLEVARAIMNPPAVISAVDTWCSADAFRAFLREAETFSDDAVVLGVTPLVDDERPLWVRLDPDGRVREIGIGSGEAVTAGLYVIPGDLIESAGAHSFDRLRDFLKWLVAGSRPVYGVVLPAVVDVDRQEDIALAAAANIDAGVPGAGSPGSGLPGGERS